MGEERQFLPAHRSIPGLSGRMEILQRNLHVIFLSISEVPIDQNYTNSRRGKEWYGSR